MLFELGAAMMGGKKIIPVLPGEMDVTRIPPALRRFQVLAEKSPQEAGRRLAEIIGKNGQRSGASVVASV